MKVDFTLIGLIIVEIQVFQSFSIPLPFFPRIAKNKAISDGMIGLILASHGIGQTLSALIYAKLMYMFNKKTLLYSNLIVCCIGTLVFGMLDQIDDT